MTNPHNSHPSYRPVAARVVTFVFGGIAVILLLHLAFILFDANLGNPLVELVDVVANWFGYLFSDMFSLDDLKLQAILNYGLAAVAYLAVGAGIRTLFRRHS